VPKPNPAHCQTRHSSRSLVGHFPSHLRLATNYALRDWAGACNAVVVPWYVQADICQPIDCRLTTYGCEWYSYWLRNCHDSTRKNEIARSERTLTLDSTKKERREKKELVLFSLFSLFLYCQGSRYVRAQSCEESSESRGVCY